MFDFVCITGARIWEVRRVTNETNVHVRLNVDGTGISDCSTGIPFLDHMLDVSTLFSLFFLKKRSTFVVFLVLHSKRTVFLDV